MFIVLTRKLYSRLNDRMYRRRAISNAISNVDVKQYKRAMCRKEGFNTYVYECKYKVGRREHDISNVNT